MEKVVGKMGKFIRTFPRKHHVEYITALLSIPVLLSVIALNVFNLQNTTRRTAEPTPAPTTDRPIIIEVSGPQERENNVPTPTDSPVCKEEVGPISITFPQEGAVVKDSPVCINIRYADEDYCSVVWSYRINNGTWSEYNSNSPCLYNLPTGDVKFELRVQSTVSQDTDVLERTFKYEGVASDSAQ